MTGTLASTKTVVDVAVILAGGLSRRMGGGDKCLRLLAGEPMLHHTVRVMTGQATTMVINANGDPARFAEFSLPVTPDTIEGFAGPLAGVVAGLDWAATHSPDTSHVLSVPSDAPFLPPNLAAKLLAAVDNRPRRIALAQSGGKTHPVVGLWPTALTDDLRGALNEGVRKVLHWTDRHDTVFVEFEEQVTPGGVVDPFYNANTQEDMELAEQILSGSTNR